MERNKTRQKKFIFPLSCLCKIKQIHHQEHFATFQADLEQNLAEVRVDIQAAQIEKNTFATKFTHSYTTKREPIKKSKRKETQIKSKNIKAKEG